MRSRIEIFFNFGTESGARPGLDRRQRCNWYGTCATGKRMQPGTSWSYSVPRCGASNQCTDEGQESVNYVKQTVLDVLNGNPILSDDRPAVVILATHEGAQISLLRLDGIFWWCLNRQRQESGYFRNIWFRQERRDHLCWHGRRS